MYIPFEHDKNLFSFKDYLHVTSYKPEESHKLKNYNSYKFILYLILLITIVSLIYVFKTE